MTKLAVGDKAPAFTLKDQNGKAVKLSGAKGHRVVVYFYPKADTPGCTQQSCSLRDAFPQLKKLNAVVFGISPDPVDKQKKFDDKYGLGFPLLADTDHSALPRRVDRTRIQGATRSWGANGRVSPTATTLDPAGLSSLDNHEVGSDSAREEVDGVWVDQLLAQIVRQRALQSLEAFDIERLSTPGESMLPPQFRRRFRRNR